MSADALLTPAGEQRAKLLALLLKDAGVQRIYVTEVRRTQQTAQPVAERLHLTPIVIPQSDTDALIGQLQKLGEDETVLVVGHANTVPLIVERLGAGPAPAMADSEYDRLTVLVTSAHGKPHAVTLRYGNVAE
jgi:broad specificity phosphatase PhoE